MLKGYKKPALKTPMSFWLGEKYYPNYVAFAKIRHSDSNSNAGAKLVALAAQELWVREKTGNNDGERVEEYLSVVGLRRGEPWCAAFISFIFNKAGYREPRSGWSPSLFPTRRLARAAAPGNVFGIYFPALKRIGHCGLVEHATGDWVSGIEGNTDAGGGRDGDGVYRRKRHQKTIYRYADWNGKR